MDRSGFLKALGLGVAGVATAKLDSLFTPDVEKQIEELKNQILKQIPTFSKITYKHTNTIITNEDINNKTLFDWNFNECEAGMLISTYYIDSWFTNIRKKKKPVDDPNRVEMAINVFNRWIEVMNTVYHIDTMTDNLGKCYLLLNDPKTAQFYFEKNRGYNNKTVYYDSVKELFECRGFEMPKDFKFNNHNENFIEENYDFYHKRNRDTMGKYWGPYTNNNQSSVVIE